MQGRMSTERILEIIPADDCCNGNWCGDGYCAGFGKFVFVDGGLDDN